VNNLEYLASLELHGVKLGLENIRHILKALDSPQDAYPTIHVAGTNGKGSTVAVAAAIAAAAGYRVGRFTSPHIIRTNERFLINGEPISDSALDRQLGLLRNIAGEMEYPPTYFEMTTAIAFNWFRESDVDLAVIEVGLGGRLDSTNVITPKAAAITNIELEHVAYLGPTLGHIAREKAGIIKQKVPLVLGAVNDEAKAAIMEVAALREAPVRILGDHFTYELSGDAFARRFSYKSARLSIDSTPFSLPARYQGENAAVALAVMEQMTAVLPRIDESAIRAGLGSVRWPCRFEKVLDSPPVIIDVAHNPAGAEKLAGELATRAIVVLAVSSDKDMRRMGELLAPVAEEFIFTQFSGPRATPAESVKTASGLPGSVVPSLEHALEIGLAKASADTPLLITGSIFTAGEARQLLVEKHGAMPLLF
jgi:dihydrofolate synthase/folylpolyglutamate synthase